MWELQKTSSETRRNKLDIIHSLNLYWEKISNIEWISHGILNNEPGKLKTLLYDKNLYRETVDQ